jgi:hypothetical protein
MGKRFTGTEASASLRDLDVTGGDLAFVGGEGPVFPQQQTSLGSVGTSA